MTGEATEIEARIERFAAMGTRVELHVFTGGDAQVPGAARRAIAAVDDALTIHRPSPATAMNDALIAGDIAIIENPLLYDALIAADDANRATCGLFDIAADVRSGATWAQLTFDREHRRVAARTPLALDFGGLGKGFALDRAAGILRAGGVTSALLSAGESSISVIGAHPLGGAWPFAIPHPTEGDTDVLTVDLIDEALSISSTLGAGASAPDRAAMVRPGGGVVAAPRTTIAIAPGGAMAEAMSTALLVADRERADRLLTAGPSKAYRFEHRADTPAHTDRVFA